MITIKLLLDALKDQDHSAMKIKLPLGETVPENFHVTEVGRIHKAFVDCGGTIRYSAACLIQVWTAHDVEHRLDTTKFYKLMKMADEKIGLDDLPIEIEYGKEVAIQYKLVDIEVSPDGLLFVLDPKQTECLAPDKCGVPSFNKDSCSGDSCC